MIDSHEFRSGGHLSAKSNSSSAFQEASYPPLPMTTTTVLIPVLDLFAMCQILEIKTVISDCAIPCTHGTTQFEWLIPCAQAGSSSSMSGKRTALFPRRPSVPGEASAL